MTQQGRGTVSSSMIPCSLAKAACLPGRRRPCRRLCRRSNLFPLQILSPRAAGNGQGHTRKGKKGRSERRKVFHPCAATSGHQLSGGWGAEGGGSSLGIVFAGVNPYWKD